MDEPVTAKKADVFVSVVALLDDDLLDVAERVATLAAEVAERYRNYEIVVIDDQRPPHLLIQLRELLANVACIRVLRLSRRATSDTAIFAGLDSAIGDYVIVTSLATDSAQALLEVAQLLQDGHDVVQGEYTGRLAGGLAVRAGRRAFFWYNRRFLRLDIPVRTTYLTGLTRSAVNSVSASGRSHRYIRHLVRYVGYRVHPYRYTVTHPLTARSRTRPRVLEAIEMVSSYSTQPLRVVALLGLVAGLLSLLYGVYVLAVNATQAHVVAGWTTTSLQMSVMFFVVSLILAVQAEYVGRVLNESRREPAYFVVEELESDTLIAEMERRNVALA